jgi:hypothetical protein
MKPRFVDKRVYVVGRSVPLLSCASYFRREFEAFTHFSTNSFHSERGQRFLEECLRDMPWGMHLITSSTISAAKFSFELLVRSLGGKRTSRLSNDPAGTTQEISFSLSRGSLYSFSILQLDGILSRNDHPFVAAPLARASAVLHPRPLSVCSKRDKRSCEQRPSSQARIPRMCKIARA